MITCNDQTFYIGGKHYQLVRSIKYAWKYSVCKIEHIERFGGNVRVNCHSGDLKSCLEYIQDEIVFKEKITLGDEIKAITEKYLALFEKMQNSSIEELRANPKGFTLIDLRNKKWVLEMALRELEKEIDKKEKNKSE